MRICCPFCGDRDVSEFSYLGDAAYRRPQAGAPLLDVLDAVYLRDNPAGPHTEHWYHTYGCRCFLRVRRDTRTHQMLEVELAQPGHPA